MDGRRNGTILYGNFQDPAFRNNDVRSSNFNSQIRDYILNLVCILIDGMDNDQRELSMNL